MKRKRSKKAPEYSQRLNVNSNTNTLSDFDLKVKIVFQMIDETNSINQLRCMQLECKEEGRPHLVAYIDRQIDKLRERAV